LETGRDNSFAECNWGVAAAVLLQFRPCGCVDGTSDA